MKFSLGKYLFPWHPRLVLVTFLSVSIWSEKNYQTKRASEGRTKSKSNNKRGHFMSLDVQAWMQKCPKIHVSLKLVIRMPLYLPLQLLDPHALTQLTCNWGVPMNLLHPVQHSLLNGGSQRYHCCRHSPICILARVMKRCDVVET